MEEVFIHNIVWGGYILGEIILSRSALTGDIYFIYVHNMLRGSRCGTKIYQLFERVVIERSAGVGIKTAMIRIALKPCIVNSLSFWKNNGFEGSKESACLIKILKLN